jgi:hypothetical protein
MWLFTDTGFISVVGKGGSLTARARDQKSLAPLANFAGATIRKSPTSDYPYRLSLSRDAFADWAAMVARNVRYENFKSEVAITRGADYSQVLTSVWSVMHQVEDVTSRLEGTGIKK